MGKLPEYHVLNFFHDDNGCSLTALVQGERYHVVADSRNLQDRSKAGKRISREFRKRIEQSKDAQVDDAGEKQTAPLFVQEDEDEDSDEGKDSAVDVQEDEDDSTDEPSKALERWMLSPLKEVFSKSSLKKSVGKSVQDWYHCPTNYYHLHIKDSKLEAQAQESPNTNEQKRTDTLIPTMPLPKYLRNLNIPPIAATDLTVLAESDEIAPIHPATVQHDGKSYFLKVVDNTQHGPLKRELQVMHKIYTQNLQSEIRVPLLRGLVHFSNNTTNIMGFIMDAIDSPTPLTHLLSTDVEEDKRLAWADEAARVVDVLHQHEIIWGDAKGDNFVVDGEGKLWIIDFGGSYTEGWVDKELNETVEGDDMGVRRVVNGLRDPVGGTIGGEEEDGEGQEDEIDEEQADEDNAEKDEVDETRALRREVSSCKDWEDSYEKYASTQKQSSKKRKANDTEGRDDGNEKPSKQQKIEKDEGPRYCYCNGPDSGKMLACDGEKCTKQWFHFDCVGIEEAPSEKKWYCEDCRED